MQTIIRSFQPGDARQFYEIGKEFNLETKVADMTGGLNQAWFENYLEVGVAGGLLKILVLEDAGKIVGSLAMMVGIDPFSGHVFLSELFWYVKKEYRGDTNILRMLDMMENIGRKAGCRYISMFHLMDLKAEKLNHFYLKYGYKHIQEMYIKEF